MRELLKKFFIKDQEGSAIALFALVMLPILVLTGLTIEAGRQNYYETKLAYAADAAAIAAARYNIADVQTNGLKFFWANFPQNSSDVSVTPTITLSSDQTTVTVSVTGTMNTILGGLVGLKSLSLGGSSTVQRSLQNIEIALVLDTTGSMAQNGKMPALQSAANQLLNTLYQGQNTRSGIAVSIVPFVAAVNIGTSYTSWLSNPQIITDKSYFPTGVPWKGCVMAVDTGTTMDTDAPPSATRKWPVYQTPSTILSGALTTGNITSKANLILLGDNAWLDLLGIFQVIYPSVPTVGPNRSCGIPLMGLTNNLALLQSKINSLAPVDGGGTFGNLGLVWGWNTISPNWVGLWGTGIDPQPYGTTVKSIVFVTDGQNDWNTNSIFNPTDDPTAYGHINQGLLGTTSLSQARSYIDKRMLSVCSAIKNSGIQIFTIGVLVSDSTALQNLQTCATKPEWAFQATNTTDLNTYFTNIGTLLQNITIIK